METGRTVVLLNLENLYESLYDALNQYYVYFGDQRYVDLGLGSHRVKCRVHRDFRYANKIEDSVILLFITFTGGCTQSVSNVPMITFPII